MKTMATLMEQLQKAKKITKDNLSKELFAYIKSIKEELIEMEKNRLFNESKDINGKPIGFYSYATEVISKGKKKAGEPFTAKDSGDFFKGFYMQETSGVLRFGSKSPHWAEIQKSDVWLSKELFGLSDTELEKVIEEKLLPFFIQNSRKKIGV